MLSIFTPTDFALRKTDVTDLEALPEKAVWIDLVKPTPEEDHAVERLAGIAVPTREDILERAGADMDMISHDIFEPEGAARTGHAKRYSDILIAIGRKGDLTSKVRESLVSIGRLVAFLSASVEGIKWSKEMREQLKTM